MMTLDDLKFIFSKQIKEGTTSLYFLLVDGAHKVVEHHPLDKIEELIPMLEHFELTPFDPMPRFVK
jgi:hypothetical protein